MDFLSTGEKIKRARIYKGLTLKQLCEDDISISRMSCIENGKVKADKWVLELVAKRLDLDLEYLLCDDITQLNNSIDKYIQKKVLTESEADEIKEYMKSFPVLLISGARQVGKSTLALNLDIPNYVTLDDINIYESARNDPKGFIEHCEKPIVIDEIQREL